MSTPKQVAANQVNATLSTGPRTEAGKRKVAINSLRHGFAGQTVFIPDHERQAYTEHFQQFRTDYKPVGKTEEFLVQSLAELSWSVQQMRAVSNNILALLGAGHCPIDAPTPEQDFALAQAANISDRLKEINLLGLYEQRKLRLFNQTRKELETVQKNRKQAEEEELKEAAIIRANSTNDWTPSQDGFACSLPQIDRFISRQRQLGRAS